MPTIIIFTADNQYRVLSHMVAEIGLAFESLGYQAEIIDRSRPDFGDRLLRILDTADVSFMFSIGYGGFNLTDGTPSFYDQVDVPLFSFLVDHPVYIQVMSDRGWDNDIHNHVMSCVDSDHATFLRQRTRQNVTVTFIPHGTSLHLGLDDLPEMVNRDIDVLFPGSFADPNQIRREWASTDALLRKALDEIAEASIENPTLVFADVVMQTMQMYGIEPDAFVNPRPMWSMVGAVDRYIRNVHRERVVRALAGCNVHLAGSGWSDTFSNQFTVHGPLNFPHITRLMRRSKIIVSNLPNFQFGLHERILESMANRAVSLTDTNPYVNECFSQDTFISYQKGDLIGLQQRVLEQLANTSNLQDMADGGYDAVKAKHTWRHRAEQVIATMHQHQLARR